MMVVGPKTGCGVVKPEHKERNDRSAYRTNNHRADGAETQMFVLVDRSLTLLAYILSEHRFILKC